MTAPSGWRGRRQRASSRHNADGPGDAKEDGSPVGEETVSGEGVITVGLGLARAGTLLLGGIQLSAGSPGEDGALAAMAFAVVTSTSVAVFVRAILRIRRQSARRPLDARAAMAETLAGLTGLLLLRAATPPDALVGPEFWMLPYTVVTAVLFAAVWRRVIPGLAGSIVLTAGYLVSVSPALDLGSAAGRGAAVTALDNALSYFGFYALGIVMFNLHRFVTGEVAMLRRLAAHNSAERARLRAARAAYRLGHDYPKAYLRELRRAERPTADLRLWAARFRSDLLTALAADPRTEVDLEEEMAKVVDTFAGAVSIRLETRGLTDTLPGVPILVVAEAVRECLNNASYHCHGAAVTATAASVDGTLTVTVRDDGPGCNPEQVMAAWALKQNAVYLVEAAGGAYAVESGAAGGTTVRLSYPLSRQASGSS